jgi:hypothetical protein
MNELMKELLAESKQFERYERIEYNQKDLEKGSLG